MPPSIRAGLVGIDQGHNDAVFSVRDVSPKIHLLQADIAPITSVIMNMRNKKRATNVKVEWNERQTMPHTTTSNGGNLIADTTLDVNDDFFQVGNYVLIKASAGNEWVKVTAIPGTGQITVTRAQRGTTAKAITDGDVFIISRGTIADGGDAVAPAVTLPENKFNYIDPISTVYSNSDMLERMNTYGDVNSMEDMAKIRMIDHMEEREKRVLYSTRFRTATTPYEYFMGGLFENIVTEVETVVNNPKTFDEDDWNNFLRRGFRYSKGSKRKSVYASGEVIQMVDKFKREVIRLDNSDTMKMVANFSYASSFGHVDMVHHRMLSAEFGTDWTAILIDHDRLEWNDFEPQMIRRNIQNNRAHSREDEIYDSGTIKVITEANHAIFKVNLA